jgi:lipopolysaccharide biosynthesis protein
MTTALQNAIKLIAFYLPQYHPIPENDAWWGRGFTEWRNVVRAKPLFKGHYQPHLPADVGFYDLRVPEVRELQAQIAREYGIHGFCYYHYWFNGKRLLNRPLDDIVASGSPDFPFCLCWANESWSRRWDGLEKEMLMAQTYSDEDDVRHIEALIPYFKSPSYITVEGKPLFLVYKASRHPNISHALDIWREAAKKHGLNGIYLCNVESEPDEHGIGIPKGFDAAVEFAPDWGNLPKSNRNYFVWRAIAKLGLKSKNSIRHYVYDYEALVDKMLDKKIASYPRIPCVTPMWDNSARRKEFAKIFHGSTPEKFERWLTVVINRELQKKNSPGIVFINAWNEWAEGNHLEPCQKWGTEYLEATRRALSQAR